MQKNYNDMKDREPFYKERKRIGKRIATIRQESCMSVEDLAEITGFKAGTLSRKMP